MCDDCFGQVYWLICSNHFDSQCQIVISTGYCASDDSQWRNSAKNLHVGAGEIKIVTICNAGNNIVTDWNAFNNDSAEHFCGSQGAHRGNQISNQDTIILQDIYVNVHRHIPHQVGKRNVSFGHVLCGVVGRV